jgi:hypothetical protein
MEPNRKSEILDTLRLYWKENPVAVITAGALAVTAVAKLIDAVSAARGRRAYAKQVNYRVRHRK